MWSGSKAEARWRRPTTWKRARGTRSAMARASCGRRHEAIAGADDRVAAGDRCARAPPSSRSRRARASDGCGRCARSRARSRRLRRRCRSAGAASAGGRRRAVRSAISSMPARRRTPSTVRVRQLGFGALTARSTSASMSASRVARQVRERDVAEQAVADAGQRQRRETRAREGDQRRHVVLDEIVVAPVAAFVGARAALAVAAQVGDDAGDAARRRAPRRGRGRAGDRACGGRPSSRGRRRRRRPAAHRRRARRASTQPSAQATEKARAAAPLRSVFRQRSITAKEYHGFARRP